jgi:site-specific recombinase
VKPEDRHPQRQGVPAGNSLAAEARRHLEPILEATTLPGRMDGLVDLVRWARGGWEDPASPPSRHLWSRRRGGRLDAALALLESDSELRRGYQEVIAAVLREGDATNVFGHAGIPSERGFLAELGERIMDRLLPRPRNDRDLATLLRRLFRSAADVERFDEMPEELFERFVRLHSLADHPEVGAGLRRTFADGFRLLATWTQSQGLSPKLRKRSRPCEVTASPFHRIAQLSEGVVARWLAGEALAEEAEAWRRESERCREEMAEIHRQIQREGVSTHVVYGLEMIERCLTRMAMMLDIMAAPSEREAATALHRLFARLASSVNDDRSVRHLTWWTTHLLQRRIVERSGRTGEHYIANTRSEYRHMWLAAAGGGLLTVGTAAIKTAISGWHAPDFVHGLLYGLNYAVSFLLMQRFGLVLATKQPAMTAAALAAIVRERRGAERADEITEYAARITRSQLAAVLGNLLVVGAGSAVFVVLWAQLFGRPFLAEAEAAKVYKALSPVNSLTVFYAALTGVILWLASVIGGWFDNFCAYHRLPLAVAQHPVGDRLGRARMERWGEALADNGAGWATNVSLGFMLGMTPAIGHFLGVPLDVRHVTLNSGVLSLASASLGRGWFSEGMFLRGLAGVAVMFVLNLSVSFVLALVTAARAYELPPSGVRELLRTLYRRFVTAPRDFLLPPRRDPPPLAPSAGGH